MTTYQMCDLLISVGSLVVMAASLAVSTFFYFKK